MYLTELESNLNMQAKSRRNYGIYVQRLVGYLIVSQCVESFPVIVYLSGDILILKDDSSNPALPPLCHTEKEIQVGLFRLFMNKRQKRNMHCIHDQMVTSINLPQKAPSFK